MQKAFIIGLPRTGTTSVCTALLECGFKVAHTAYTQQTFALADVVADTPCYCDYPQLDRLFPGSRFVYLDRDLTTWLPSMRMLLSKITPYLTPESHFNPIIKRCYSQTFQLKDTADPLDESHLTHCYQQHQHAVKTYFSGRDDLISIDVSQPNGLTELLRFLGQHGAADLSFPRVNTGRMVTAWKDIKHPNKISSNEFGPQRRKFFAYHQLLQNS